MEQTTPYSLLNAGKIVGGAGCIGTIVEEVRACGAKTALIITDKGVWQAGLVARPKALLEAAGIQVDVINDTPPEPEVKHVEAVFEQAKRLQCDMIIGIGGGSAMDVAKLVALLLTNDMTVRDMLQQAPIRFRGVPTLLVPTTAGTGAEMTPNAIVLVPEDELKVGIVSPKMLPDCVIVDPELTVKLPPAITASTGMDALCHAIECYISKKANPLSDTFALKAVSLIYRSLRLAYTAGEDLAARHDMILGAMFGGMSIATSGTTAVHALAYPLGGKYHIPHGLSNAILLPYVMEFNMDAAQKKFCDIAAAMGVDVTKLTAAQAAQCMIDNLYSLVRELNINTSLKDKGITEADLDDLVESAAKVTRLLNNNPKVMTKEDIRAVYRQLL